MALTASQRLTQITIVAYLGYKLGVSDTWHLEPQEFLFGKTPMQIIGEGDGKILIEWMEERLGLRKGQAF